MHPFNAGRTPESGITGHTIQNSLMIKRVLKEYSTIPNLITLQSIQSIIAEIQYLFKASNSIQYPFQANCISALANQKQSHNQSIQSNSFQIDQT